MKKILDKTTKGIKSLVEEPELVIKKAVRKSVILSVIVLLLVGGLIYFTVTKIKSYSRDLQAKQNLIYLTNQQIQVGNETLKNWKEIEPNLDKVENALPSPDDLLGYLGFLESIAATSGVEQTVKMQSQDQQQKKPQNIPGQENKNGSSVAHTIDLKGNFEQIANYISLLEKAPYFIQITSINISSNQDLSQEGVALIGLNVYTYP